MLFSLSLSRSFSRSILSLSLQGLQISQYLKRSRSRISLPLAISRLSRTEPLSTMFDYTLFRVAVSGCLCSILDYPSRESSSPETRPSVVVGLSHSSFCCLGARYLSSAIPRVERLGLGSAQNVYSNGCCETDTAFFLTIGSWQRRRFCSGEAFLRDCRDSCWKHLGVTFLWSLSRSMRSSREKLKNSGVLR